MHILTPDKELILPRCHAGIEGRFQLRRIRIDERGNETVIEETPVFKNLITNRGLDVVAGSFGIPAIQVGSGNATPQFTDTALQAYVAGTNTQQAEVVGLVNTGGERYFWRRRTMRFAQGVAAGNLSEVAVSSAVSGGNLLSRALILDSLGAPTTITVTALDFLDVMYEIRWHVPMINTDEGAFNIGGVSTNVQSGPVAIYTSGQGSSQWTTNIPSLDGGTNGNWWRAVCASSNTLLPHTSDPTSGTFGNDIHITKAAYVNGTHQRQHSVVLGINDWNVPGGIGALRITNTGFCWQYVFNPKIAKDNTKQLTLRWIVSWGRV